MADTDTETTPQSETPFDLAARRTRESVRPSSGRQEGFSSYVLENYVPAVAERLVTLPQRALGASEALRLRRAGEDGNYDLGPIVEVAGMMVGTPMTPRGALGSGASRRDLPMDDASRMARSRQMSYSPEPFYRGEATGKAPTEYPSGAHFSRDPEIATGFANRGGTEAREFRLDLTKALKDYEPVTAAEYGRIIESAARIDPKFAQTMADAIAPGKGVDWLLGFAKQRPDFIVADSGAHIRQAVERSSNPVGILRGAGITALDTGRDVRTLSGAGTRLRSARFDPENRSSRDITAGIAAASGAPWLLGPNRSPNEE